MTQLAAGHILCACVWLGVFGAGPANLRSDQKDAVRASFVCFSYVLRVYLFSPGSLDHVNRPHHQLDKCGRASSRQIAIISTGNNTRSTSHVAEHAWSRKYSSIAVCIFHLHAWSNDPTRGTPSWRATNVTAVLCTTELSGFYTIFRFVEKVTLFTTFHALCGAWCSGRPTCHHLLVLVRGSAFATLSHDFPLPSTHLLIFRQTGSRQVPWLRYQKHVRSTPPSYVPLGHRAAGSSGLMPPNAPPDQNKEATMWDIRCVISFTREESDGRFHFDLPGSSGGLARNRRTSE